MSLTYIASREGVLNDFNIRTVVVELRKHGSNPEQTACTHERRLRLLYDSNKERTWCLALVVFGARGVWPGASEEVSRPAPEVPTARGSTWSRSADCLWHRCFDSNGLVVGLVVWIGGGQVL